ncbi:MAG TPA: DUF3618 domain-containing protein [Devosiaceae bacterium]|jgi:hypothetical protein|nr:DUF3618 domain-containing protein [Devosiaceae bacterium]
MNGNGKTSAQLEREVEEQRHLLETRVSEIQRRLSPGQLVDELMSYAKTSGGQEFVGNLSRSVQANPLPIALTGIGLAWLMLRPNGSTTVSSDREWDRRLAENGQSADFAESYPRMRIQGQSLRRVRDFTDEAGRRYTEFKDDAGATFKALSDEAGNRAGNFVDEAGRFYSGFMDEAGNRISTFLDEAGMRLADAQGWASDTWSGATQRLGGLQDGVAGRAAALKDRAVAATSQLQSNTGALGSNLAQFLREQPLVGGALAFAIGAAIASALPPTQQEDELIGETADRLKKQGRAAAGDAYEKGKEQLADAFDGAREEAGNVYAKVKDDLTSGTQPERLH